MRNISDIIEGYLKKVIELDDKGHVEIKRSEIAEQFQCVPSQINYVINTRFTADRGYLVESKRGGGGYIRIVRVRAHTKVALIEGIMNSLQHGASQTMTEDIVFRLIDEDVVTKREAKMMLAALDRTTLNLPLPMRDDIRSRILLAILLTIKYEQAK
jgi:transcriptional regulator CtsR